MLKAVLHLTNTWKQNIKANLFYNKISVIAFTAALYNRMDLDLKSKDFNDYLHKPFNPTYLYNKISSYKMNKTIFLLYL